ncbi:MAG: hypothetical protein DMG23_08845 [Acidobacteria bacterium]|nr:MAG: hypothetical protein DMG23_08845 [Acidobacteriota bacterium]
MPSHAKLYIACVALLGLATLALALSRGTFPDPTRFLVFSFLALLASTLKVSLPGFTGTISVSFLFILVGIADLNFTETLTMASAAALVQSIWKPRRRPKPVQILFNTTSLAISVGVAYWGSHSILPRADVESIPVLLALAASLYFLSNTGLVSAVVSLAEQKPFRETWRNCNAWTFPYYLVGAAIAGLISVLSRSLGWKLPLIVLSMMYLTYIWYRQYLEIPARKN